MLKDFKSELQNPEFLDKNEVKVIIESLSRVETLAASEKYRVKPFFDTTTSSKKSIVHDDVVWPASIPVQTRIEIVKSAFFEMISNWEMYVTKPSPKQTVDAPDKAPSTQLLNEWNAAHEKLIGACREFLCARHEILQKDDTIQPLSAHEPLASRTTKDSTDSVLQKKVNNESTDGIQGSNATMDNPSETVSKRDTKTRLGFSM
jgi:hypothetical protein